MDDRLQRREFWRMTEHAGTEFLAIDAARSGGAGKARLARRDQRAARPLQPMHLVIGFDPRPAFAFEHRGSCRLDHAARAGAPSATGAPTPLGGGACGGVGKMLWEGTGVA